ncbi:SulP family inorganic anion transporter [Nocardioides daeguensis]|uniref:SulP family inorganic anion transporter n=1 Tax=Nocardioides daeguensis TaxID=908359 RepID=A0ABP6UWQ3_9ACTN|nr:SulP family inorganic anion transporter [Nocardioides daeguensis]MBV6728737.1 SulP family inorganic anion transporter [Nocardioides daeguensis]MCR1773653.1 SulP family inorganic anion transporter [Nocardioides daeguensis]
MSTLLDRARQLAPRRADWAQADLRHDLTAGVMVALVALPLALGFGVSSGVGAGAGIVTAVVAGAIAAVFGGSHVQVSGPTGAMTVVLIPIVAAHGIDGVLVVGLLAGLMLLGLAVTGAGRAIRYVPVPVIEGFTAGIAVIIALQQLPAALGVEVHAEKVLVLATDAVRAWAQAPSWGAPATAGGIAVLIVAMARVRAGFPAALFLIVLATVGNALLADSDGGTPLATIGTIPSGLPAPHLPSVPWGDLDTLVLAAVAVAALGALESLLSATVADAMSVGQRHDPDRELLGQGLANLVSPLFGGIPATAAIARTAVNVRSGARSRLAALTHAVLLLVVVLVAARWVGQIPLAALAGVLIATAVQMIRVSSLAPLLRATRGDAATLLLTAAATVALDLVLAVTVGLAAAGFFALRQTARTARLEEEPLDNSDHTDEERRLLDENIVAYRLDGPLFFAAAHDFLLELAEVKRVRVVVLRMAHLTAVDATGAHVLADTIGRLEQRGVTVLLSGTRPEHLAVLEQLGVHRQLAHERHLFATTPEAIAHARLHAARIAHEPGLEREAS